MKHPFRAHILPLFPLAAGALGLLLRLWLFSAVDEKGLLPASHFADSALYILTALTLGLLFPVSRSQHPRPIRQRFSRAASVLGCLLGSIGMILTGFSHQSTRFSGIGAAACIVGGLALLAMAVLKIFRKRISYVFPATLTLALMLDTISQCQSWGSAPQLQEYFFPLMASVFLILSVYHITMHIAGSGKPDLLTFFSQSAVFFCCTCLNISRWFFYLGLLLWIISLQFPCNHKQKEA